MSVEDALEAVSIHRSGSLSLGARLSATLSAPSVSFHECVPSRPGDLTAAWLAKALVEGGVMVAEEDVLSISVIPVEAQGYISETVRVTLELAPGATGPSRVIIKLPTVDEGRLEVAVENDTYEMEYRFYEEVAAKLQEAEVPLARCLHAAVDPVNDLWVLVLEDLTLKEGYKPGDEIRGMTYDQMEAGCISLARLHGAFWGKALPGWVPGTNEIPILNVVQAVQKYWDSWRGSDVPTRAGVSTECMAATECLVANIEMLERMLEEGPQTLCHHDARSDNIFFGPGEGDGKTSAVLLDWQFIGRGKGCSVDVARMVMSHFEPSPDGIETQRKLVGAYHSELLKHLSPEDAAAYSLDDCWRDYRIGAAWLIFNALVWCPKGPFYVPDDGSRSSQLMANHQRYVKHYVALDVASLFNEA